MAEDERASSEPATPLAVIGIGCMFPKAADLPSYWANISGAVDAITDIPATHWRAADYFDPDRKAPDRTYARRGGFLSPTEFSPIEFGIAPADLEAIDTAQLLGLVAARQALEDAGYGADRQFDRDRVSVILGVTGTLELVIPLGARLGHPLWRRALAEAGVDPETADRVIASIAAGYVDWQENSFPGLLGNVVAGRIANRLDLRGTNCVVDAACASSLSALHLASLELATGRAEMVVTGGIDTFNDIFMYMCFSKTPALSPTGDARPFAANADGTILGEGLGVLVLKRLETARRDGDRIYAVIRGLGSSSDGKGTAVYAPKAEGQIAALRAAYRNAGVTPDTIELVEAHGTGTAVGDATEVEALVEVFRERRPQGTWCALGSVKSQIGHTKAAAGAAGLIKAILALYHKVLPPTIKVDRPIDLAAVGRSPCYVNTQARPWLPAPDHPRRAAVSSFGFGGSNFHCVLEEADPQKKVVAWDPGVEILALSASSAAALRERLAGLPISADWPVIARSCAALRGDFDGSQPVRLAAVVERDKTDWPKLLDALAASVSDEHRPPPAGVFVGHGPATGKLALLFPGQGSQYVGMLSDLACAFGEFLAVLQAADAAIASGGLPGGIGRLSDAIYPHPAFDPAVAAAQEAVLRGTAVAQPAIAAVSYAAWKVLESFGTRADCAAGHSFGELVALCAAERFAAADLLRLSMIRGRLMANGNGAAGAMLAVHAPLEVVADLLRTEGLDLVIANKNAPRQAVLSGRNGEIDRAAECFAQRQLRSTRLAVAAAFHSPMVAKASAPFAEALGELALAPGSIPVFSNTTAAPYPAESEAVRSLLAGHLARPVEFVEQIRGMHRYGVRTFVEVGPGNQLTGLVDAILADEQHTALSIDGARGRRRGLVELARVLAQLAALGQPVNLTAWNAGLSHPRPPRRGLSVALCGANYVRPKPAQTAGRTSNHQNGTDAASGRGSSSGTAAAAGGSHQAPAPARREPSRTIVAAPPPSGPLDAPNPSMAAMEQSSNNASPALPAGNAGSTSENAAAPIHPAFWVTQQNIAALQKLQEQTAQAHLRFLESQESALRALESLLAAQQQQVAAAGGSGVPVIAHGALAAPPAPPPAVSPPAPAIDYVAPPVPAPAPSDGQPPLAAQTQSAARAAALIEIVAEKTGYPTDMLDLDMELDADLGIDSIKRVEILSALQERFPDAPTVKSDELGTFRTLRQVADYLAGGPSVAATASTLSTSPAAQRNGTNVGERVDAPAMQAALIEVVAEKTGYPTDMLELDMELDADLGIDSIKRVEILSALQERFPDAPTVKSDELGTFRTLRSVVEFLGKDRGSPPRESSGITGDTTTAKDAPTSFNEDVRIVFGPHPAVDRYEVVADTLADDDRPTLELPEGREVWITDDRSSLIGNLVEELQGRGLAPRRVSFDVLHSTDRPSLLGGLIVVAPLKGADTAFIRSSFALLQHTGPGLRESGRSGGAFLVTVSRMDGTFGLMTPDAKGDWNSGGLAGLAKTVVHEWPEVHAKAIDLAVDYRDLPEAAAAIVGEALLVGPVEVGLRPGKRYTPRLRLVPLTEVVGSVRLRRGEVVVVTGGARGVTADAVLALARACRPTLVLLGRSKPPTAEPDWLKGLTSEAEIKRALAGRGAAGPAAIRAEYQAIVANREVMRNLERLSAAAEKVVYESLDVRDADAVRAALLRVRRQLGPLRGLIHGAGVLADRFIEDKTLDQFDLVLDTKATSLATLLDAVADDDLEVLVAFSSSTARFGRTGQIDYAVANEVVNKLMQQQARLRPHCRVVSVNWGPWSGGMVTAALARVFENEGIALIPPEAGGEYLVRELFGPEKPPAEVVVVGKGSVLRPANAPVPSTLSASEFLAVAFERPLELDSHPFLKSHVLDGRPVLPVAVIVEWLAHGALHANPGLAFCGFDDLRVFKGVIVDREAPQTIQVLTGRTIRQGDFYYVPTELRSRRRDGRVLLHAGARLVLADQHPTASAQIDVFAVQPLTDEALYGSRLFHGPMFHALRHVQGWSEEGIVVESLSAPPPGEWIKTPLRGAWLADPLAIDAAFQAVILWAQERYGAPSLPCFVGGYRQFQSAFPGDGVTVVVKVVRHSPQQAIVDIEFRTADRLVAAMTGCESTIDPSLWQAFGSPKAAGRAVASAGSKTVGTAP